ncbi:MAG: Gfo/Idh/MocA family oxidoreductase [Chloroflexi bacterium]|nr:Gfo/Idh/MocA family oxidoreductase [Chloroflexota bacterium]
MTLNIGIIGCGYMGGTHAKLLAADPRVKIVAVADAAREKADALAHSAQARAFSSARELLGAGVDAVYVTTPNTMHTEAVLAALDAGLHVFSEKPMATTLPDARQIRAAAQKAKGIYQVGHNRRFAPVYQYCKRALAQGFTVTSAHIKMNRGELQNPPWVGDKAVTGGFLYETTVHLLDMARWLIGEITEIECRGAARVYGEIDNFTMLLSFAGGQFATFASCAHTTWAFPFEMIELYGAHAQIVTQEMEKVTHSVRLAEDVITHDFYQLPLPQKWGYLEEDRLFVDSILNGTPPAVNADDGYRAIELVEAVYRSAANDGERVRLPLAL